MSLENYVFKMSNTEINNLAKNRFINGSMQSEIFFRGNRTARGNLCRNPSLSNTVRDRLWKERGYVYKTELLKTGKFRGDAEKYRQLYYENEDKFYNTWSGQWRLKSTFLSSYWCERDGFQYTPADVLDSITDRIFLKPPKDSYSINNMLESLIRHPNLAVDTCVKLTTVKKENLRNLAFERLIALNKEGKIAKAN